MLSFVVTLLSGLTITTHTGIAAPQEQLLYLTKSGPEYVFAWGETRKSPPVATISAGAISRVTTGISTPQLERTGDEEDEALYLSVHTPKVTLNIECADPDETEFMVTHFEALLLKPILLQAAVAEAIRDGHWKP